MNITLLIVQALLTQGPGMARELVALFGRKPEEITPADWDKVFAHYKTPGSEYVGEDVLAKAKELVAAGKGGQKVTPS